MQFAACRNDNQVNNRKVILLSQQGGVAQQQEVCWKDIVAGDLVKVIVSPFQRSGFRAAFRSSCRVPVG
jgi:hypothetical protein